MRRLALGIIASIALCAIAIVRSVERIIDWGLRVLPFEPLTFDFGGTLQPASGFATFSDPQVDRHEAGISRRAAARNI